MSATNSKEAFPVEPVSTLTESEVQELKEIFSLVDLDGGGTISKDELATLMENLGLEASKAELANMVNEIDSRGTGEIDFDTFVQAMSRKVELGVPADVIKWSFHKFAKAGIAPGHLLVRDLIEALTEFGDADKRMSKDDAVSLVRQVAPSLGLDDLFDYATHIDMMFAS